MRPLLNVSLGTVSRTTISFIFFNNLNIVNCVPVIYSRDLTNMFQLYLILFLTVL
jgi:hypothetical protein